MKTYIIILGIIIGSTSSLEVTAQNNTGIAYGLDIGIITSPNTPDMIGINFTSKYGITERITIGGTFGYYQKTSSNDFFKTSKSFEPIAAIIEYNISLGRLNPYVGINAGGYLSSNRITGESTTMTIRDHGMLLSPVIGFNVDIYEHFKINVNSKLIYQIHKESYDKILNINFGLIYSI